MYSWYIYRLQPIQYSWHGDIVLTIVDRQPKLLANRWWNYYSTLFFSNSILHIQYDRERVSKTMLQRAEGPGGRANGEIERKRNRKTAQFFQTPPGACAQANHIITRNVDFWIRNSFRMDLHVSSLSPPSSFKGHPQRRTSASK